MIDHMPWWVLLGVAVAAMAFVWLIVDELRRK